MSEILEEQKEFCFEEYIAIKLALQSINHKKIVHNIFKKYTKQELEFIHMESIYDFPDGSEDEKKLEHQTDVLKELTYLYPFRQSLYLNSYTDPEYQSPQQLEKLIKTVKHIQNPYRFGISIKDNKLEDYKNLILATNQFRQIVLDMFNHDTLSFLKHFTNHQNIEYLQLNIACYNDQERLTLEIFIPDLLQLISIQILKIDLRNNLLDDTSLQYLGNQLSQLPHLKYLELNLRSNQITIEGTLEFLKKLNSTKYAQLQKVRLFLKYNQINETEKNGQLIQEISNSQKLDIEYEI